MTTMKTKTDSCATVGLFAGSPPIAYHSYAVGAQYKSHAPKHGRLPENIPVDEERAGAGMADSSHATVHFCRNKCDNGRENIRVSIGSELSVELTFDEFTEAFMAVVPRWFWKAKDEGA